MAKAKEIKQMDALMAPVVEFNKMVVKNAESAFNLQMDSVKAYAELSLSNLNAGLEVRSAEDFTVYAEKQKDVAQKITERVTADVKALGEMNTRFIEEARSLAEANVKTVAATAKAA